MRAAAATGSSPGGVLQRLLADRGAARRRVVGGAGPALFEHAVELEVPGVRVACPHCELKLELLGWREPYARVTRRLAQSVTRLCAVMSIRHAAEYFQLNWKTAKEPDKRSFERRLGPMDLQGFTGNRDGRGAECIPTSVSETGVPMDSSEAAAGFRGHASPSLV